MLVGCVAGAATVEEMRKLLEGAGFEDTLLVDTHKDLGLYKDLGDQGVVSVTPCCSDGGAGKVKGGEGGGDKACGPMQPRPKGRKPLDYDLNEWIGTLTSPFPSLPLLSPPRTPTPPHLTNQRTLHQDMKSVYVRR